MSGMQHSAQLEVPE